MNFADDLLKLHDIKPSKKTVSSYKKNALKESKVKDDWFPLCFRDLEQWKNWASYWRSCEQKNKKSEPNYCEDCEFEYQSKMILQKRCKYPGTTFHIDGDGFVCGVRPEGRMKHGVKSGVDDHLPRDNDHGNK